MRAPRRDEAAAAAFRALGFLRVVELLPAASAILGLFELGDQALEGGAVPPLAPADLRFPEGAGRRARSVRAVVARRAAGRT